MSRKKQYGQFFTTDPAIQDLVRQLTTPGVGGVVLEPSVGGGDLLELRADDPRGIVAVEYDETLEGRLRAHPRLAGATLHLGCFFAAPLAAGTVGTVLSNPPYVSLTEYRSAASSELVAWLDSHGFAGKTNLAFPFMLRSAMLLAHGGEMIFIVPKDFASASSAAPLRRWLEAEGRFTHWVDCGEDRHFADAALESLVIFRWERSGPGGSAHRVRVANGVAGARAGKWDSRAEVYSGDDRLLMLIDPVVQGVVGTDTLGQAFEILVSAVTGYDEAYRVPEALAHLPEAREFQAGQGSAIRLFDTNGARTEGDLSPALLAHLRGFEPRLRARYGADPQAWWRWATVRNGHVSLGPSGRPRIFVVSQTRRDPFFVGRDIGFAGSVYGLFPRDPAVTPAQLATAVRILNGPVYRDIYRASGIGVRDKFRCTPRALAQIPFPTAAKTWLGFERRLAALVSP